MFVIGKEAEGLPSGMQALLKLLDEALQEEEEEKAEVIIEQGVSTILISLCTSFVCP